ncbi:hypothetical protein QPK87_19420 [Kamptonema cortianum]|nr:hypothetical protein [Geitlerinema splendidum]MDK3158727.1 hypothetical protein [Kamptonema cortianum]
MIPAAISLHIFVEAIKQAQSQVPQTANLIQLNVPVTDHPESEIMVHHPLDPISVTKKSPKHEWEFRFVTTGLVKPPKFENFVSRFRVFAQARKDNHDDIAQWSTRMLLRLWSYNYFKVGRDHNEQFRRLVDVYLCFGGEAGGEQLFDVDSFDLDDAQRPQRVNTVYIYSVYDIEAPIQLARELAHEYGHAVLPPVGPYPSPENWANGDVGERIFLKWLRDDLAAGKITSDDICKTPLEQLDQYLAQKVNPLIMQVGTYGPDFETVNSRTEAGYHAFVALATYASQIVPNKVFGRALMLGGSGEQADFHKGLIEAVTEVRTWELSIPVILKNKAIYVPLGQGKISGAKVLARKGSWAKIQPTAEKVIVTNP